MAAARLRVGHGRGGKTRAAARLNFTRREVDRRLGASFAEVQRYAFGPLPQTQRAEIKRNTEDAENAQRTQRKKRKRNDVFSALLLKSLFNLT